jgi:hypothetical protein
MAGPPRGGDLVPPGRSAGRPVDRGQGPRHGRHRRADRDGAAADAVVDVNAQARVDGLRAALFVLALIAFLGLFSARRIPTRPPTSAGAPAAPVASGP